MTTIQKAPRIVVVSEPASYGVMAVVSIEASAEGLRVLRNAITTAIESDDNRRLFCDADGNPLVLFVRRRDDTEAPCS